MKCYRSKNFTYYSTEIKESTAALKVIAIFTNILVPYPAEIGQHDNQLVLFSDNHYFLSPYTTDSQKTTVKLSSSEIESFTKLEPQSSRQSTIVFGPYKDVGPMQVKLTMRQYLLLLLSLHIY